MVDKPGKDGIRAWSLQSIDHGKGAGHKVQRQEIGMATEGIEKKKRGGDQSGKLRSPDHLLPIDPIGEDSSIEAEDNER